METSDRVIKITCVTANLLFTTIGMTVASLGMVLSYFAGAIMAFSIAASNKADGKEEGLFKFFSGNPEELFCSVASGVATQTEKSRSLTSEFEKSSPADIDPLSVEPETSVNKSEEPSADVSGSNESELLEGGAAKA
jgi:hypothetical protein